MKPITYISWVLLQIQFTKSEIKYCPEAVASVEIVMSCPNSKEEWNFAARRKNCSGMAAQQSCSMAEQFNYHCVINGLRNNLVEVCAPKRIIFGHCVEFNDGGGIIQDQISALCHTDFPKCDSIYHSTDAYKYPDCYDLVSRSVIKPSSTTDSTSTLGESDKGQDYRTIKGIISAVVLVVAIGVLIAVVVFRLKRRLRPNILPTKGEVTSLMSFEAKNEQDNSYKENEDAVDDYHLQHKKSNPFKRNRSSHSESSAYSYIHVENEVHKEDKSKETSNRNKFSGATTPYRRRRTSLNNDDDATYSEDQFEEKDKFPYYAPKVLRNYAQKRRFSLPYVRDLDNIEKRGI